MSRHDRSSTPRRRRGDGGGDFELIPLDPAEQVTWDAYKEGIKGAIAAADSAADKVLTAAFSIATAYGALVGLVKPAAQASPTAIGAPFFILGLAALGAMLALTRTMKPSDTSGLDTLKRAVTDKLFWKRFWTGSAIVLMAIAIIIAGNVVVDNYAVSESSSEDTVEATIQVLTPTTGEDAIARACPDITTGELHGDVHIDTLDQQFIIVDAASGACLDTETTIRLPADEVAVIFSSKA